MSKPLQNVKIALLVANGFEEQSFVATQKALREAGATVHIVSPEQGLVCSWNGQGWGLNFMIDSVLKSALAADYDMLVVPGSKRNIDRLQMTAHTKRFISGFASTGKPAAVIGEALQALVQSWDIAGRTVAGPQDMQDMAGQAGGTWSSETVAIDGNLMTGTPSAKAVVDFFSERVAAPVKKAA
jgi:protease I